MGLIEFITFVAGMLFLIVSRRNGRQRDNPEEVDSEDQEQAERLREFLQTVNHEMKESPSKKLPPKPSAAPQIKRKQQKPKSAQPLFKESAPPAYLSPTLSDYANEAKAFALKTKDPYAFIKEKESRAYNLIHRLKNRKDMILLHEIIGPPKGMKREDSYGEFPR